MEEDWAKRLHIAVLVQAVRDAANYRRGRKFGGGATFEDIVMYFKRNSEEEFWHFSLEHSCALLGLSADAVRTVVIREDPEVIMNRLRVLLNGAAHQLGSGDRLVVDETEETSNDS